MSLISGKRLPSVSDLRKIKQEHGIILADAKNKKLFLIMCEASDGADGESGIIELPTRRPFAQGSGGDYAMGAMMAGSTAVDAVKAAKKVDINSGGRVRHVVLWET